MFQFDPADTDSGAVSTSQDMIKIYDEKAKS